MAPPFNGDTFVGLQIRSLIRQAGIQTIIETGTWSGDTTREFARMGPKVFTIDATHEHLEEEVGPEGYDQLARLGVRLILGDSGLVLPGLLREVEHPVLLYLDAHGGGANGSNVNPLLEELQAIADDKDCRDRCVIVVHDFQVPGKSWGFNGGDWGRGFQPLNYELIEPYLRKTYPHGYGYHYNEEADGATRGLIYVYPNQIACR